MMNTQASKRLNARLGWIWVKQGFYYFKQRPLEFCTLFVGYLAITFLFNVIPYVGEIAAFILVPLFSLSFMQGCKEIDGGRPIPARLLFFAFRLPQTKVLLQLGVLLVFTVVVALGVSALIDGGVLWKLMSGQSQIVSKEVDNSNIMGAMMFASVIYLPAIMGFWFAGPLIAWKNMPLFKAVFYSFFGCLRAVRAFLVYGLVWFGLGGLLFSVLSIIVVVITGSPFVMLLVMMPLVMLQTIIFYCSFYPTYKSVFEQNFEQTTAELTPPA
jgi:hypothetical protein